MQQLSVLKMSLCHTMRPVALDLVAKARTNAMLQATRETVDTLHTTSRWQRILDVLALSWEHSSFLHSAWGDDTPAWEVALDQQQDGLIKVISLRNLSLQMGLCPLQSMPYVMGSDQYTESLVLMVYRFSPTVKFLFQVFTSS